MHAIKNKNKNKKQQTVPAQSLQQSGHQPPADTRSWLRPTENPQGPTTTSPAGGSHNNSQQHKATPPPKFPNFADDDDTWQLVTTSKPRPKRTVLFIGNLATSTSDESLTKFVQHRAKSTTRRDVPVHNTKIFSATDGHETNFARITINSADSPLLLSRTFWPRALHCRRWHFKEQQQQQDKKQLPEGGCEHQQQQQQQQQMAGTLDDAERAAALLRSAYNHIPGSARDDDLDLSLSPDSNWGDDSDPLLSAREEGSTPVQGGKRSNDHLSPPETTGAKRADTNRGQPPSDS